MTAQAESSKQRRTLGDYEILRPLKTGGMGEVLLARKRGTAGFEKLLALKTIRAELRESDHLQKMFIDEARLLARLSHPQIAQVYDFGEQDGVFFLAMEYVPGIRFRDLIRMRPPPVVAVRAMALVLRGLHAAHELADLAGESLGVVHRDVTPENLILTYDGRIKILDFGIALMRGREAPVTEFGSVKGKPPYLAPEQLKNEAVDRRTDLFSAALVLHELLTGKPVFVGDSVYAIARAIDLQTIAAPSATAGVLPNRLDEVVLRGLAKVPDSRWHTAQAFAEALDSIANASEGVSLADFVATNLGAAREEHRRQLRVLLDDAHAASSQSKASHRATGVVTAQAAIPEVDPQALVKKLTSQRPAVLLGDGSTPTRLPSVDEHATNMRATTPMRRQTPVPVEDADVAAGRTAAENASTPDFTRSELRAVGRTPRRRHTLAAVLLLLLAGAIGVGFGLLRGESRGGADEPQQPIAAGAMDAGRTVAEAKVADAGLPVTAPPDARRARNATTLARTRVERSPKKPSNPKSIPILIPTPTSTPTPAPVQPVPTGFGRLTIAAEPFALVRIDGKDHGSTPIFGKRFSAGRHVIVLTNPDSGTIRHRRVINLAPDTHERIILR